VRSVDVSLVAAVQSGNGLSLVREILIRTVDCPTGFQENADSKWSRRDTLYVQKTGGHMTRTARLIGITTSMLLFALAPVTAQTSSATARHVVVVQLVQRDGPTPFAFEPAVVHVERGDTVRFTEAANVMHNVRFISLAPGAKLGAATVGPYLMKLGDIYTIVIDNRFTYGTYTYVCEPHQMIGMRGTMIVSEKTQAVSAR
jgi:plastocyanin